MIKGWHFNVLFWLAVGGTIFLLVAPAIDGLEDVPNNPLAIGGIGVVMAYILKQKPYIVKDDTKKKEDSDVV